MHVASAQEQGPAELGAAVLQSDARIEPRPLIWQCTCCVMLGSTERPELVAPGTGLSRVQPFGLLQSFRSLGLQVVQRRGEINERLF